MIIQTSWAAGAVCYFLFKRPVCVCGVGGVDRDVFQVLFKL